MWWPLFALDGAEPRVFSADGRIQFEPVMRDIESLNQQAIAAAAGDGSSASTNALEITAISCAAYPLVKNVYALTACGSSMGDAYGPKIIARTNMPLEDLLRDDVVIAVPGERTSAFAAMSILLGESRRAGARSDVMRAAFRYEVIPFKSIPDRVAAGDFAAGLIIHEGQLTFTSSGLHQIIDLGAWWHARTGLPMPLGVNAIRRDLDQLHGPGTLHEIATLLRQSVEYALAHREESVAYAMRFARGMTSELADEFIRLYVNKWTLDFGDIGKRAVETFLDETHKARLTPAAGNIVFVA